MKSKAQAGRTPRSSKKPSDKKKTFAQLCDEILPILEPYGVKRVALFGSVARGEQHSPKKSKTPGIEVDLNKVL